VTFKNSYILYFEPGKNHANSSRGVRDILSRFQALSTKGKNYFSDLLQIMNGCMAWEHLSPSPPVSVWGMEILLLKGEMFHRSISGNCLHTYNPFILSPGKEEGLGAN
jgi:hypothetical protein